MTDSFQPFSLHRKYPFRTSICRQVDVDVDVVSLTIIKILLASLCEIAHKHSHLYHRYGALPPIRSVDGGSTTRRVVEEEVECEVVKPVPPVPQLVHLNVNIFTFVS